MTDAPVCVVTGASQGIGKSTALALAKGGAKLVLVDRSIAGSEEVAKTIKDSGGEAITVEADVTKADDIERIFEETVSKFQTVDVLVNNAGIVDENFIPEITNEQWRSVIDTNLSSVFFMSQAALKIMAKNEKGRIISMSSICGTGFPMQANYAASKAGVEAFTKTVAKEFAKQGITCNAVAPGFIETPMAIAIGQRRPEASAALLPLIPLGYVGKPEFIADTITFLALHPSAIYITGQVIRVDGGMHM